MITAAAAALALIAAGAVIVAARRRATAARAAQQTAVLANEAGNRLAGALAHELNDLLTGIAGHAELLIVGMDPAAPGLEYAHEIFRLASGGARLTRPLRSLDDHAPAARVLVVEDEPGVRELTRAMLTRGGFDVVAVDGPRAALAALARQPAVGVMVVDLVMPEMDGYDLVAEARAARPGLPVIFVSGFAPDTRRHTAADRFLAKPFSAEEMTAAVRDALRSSPSPAADLG